MARTPESPAARRLSALGLLQDRLAELAGTSTPSISRALAGQQPMPGEAIGAMRAILGPEAADEVVVLAEQARIDRIRERAALVTASGDAL